MRESKRSGGLVDSLYCIIWVVYPKCIRQHIDVCSFSLFKQVSEGETNWAQAQPDLLNSLPQAVRTAGSICIADGLSRTSCANPQTISVLIQPWRIKASWKSTRYVWSWCTKGSYIVKPLNFSGPSYMCKESDVFPKPQGKVTGIPAGDSRGASTSSSWAFGGDNRRKTPICTVFLEDWVSQSYCWSVFWIFLKIALAVGVITPIYSWNLMPRFACWCCRERVSFWVVLACRLIPNMLFGVYFGVFFWKSFYI